jgi:metal-responsive CopG/Arc/MetJ family transcriptional regulator
MEKIEQIKVHLPKELKDKFKTKVKKNDKSQTSVIKALITKYVNE